MCLFYCISYFLVSYVVRCSRFITSVGEEGTYFSITRNYNLFGVVSSSSWCLVQAVLFYCDTT